MDDVDTSTMLWIGLDRNRHLLRVGERDGRIPLADQFVVCFSRGSVDEHIALFRIGIDILGGKHCDGSGSLRDG